MSLELGDIVLNIRRQHRQRMFCIKTQSKLDRAIESYVRREYTAWSPELPEKERVAENAKAIKIIKAARDGEGDAALVEMVIANDAAREPFDAMRKKREKAIAQLVRQLSVWESFAKPIRGCAEGSLGAIIGEAGDLSNYATHSKLWKRMCVAVLDGKRQGNPGKGASADDWIAHGYSPARRSVMWNIGDPLIKQNDGIYRQLYDMRKLYELARDPEMSKGHAHNRAKRYMEKRLLKDLWRAWRRASSSVAEKPIHPLPAASIHTESIAA